MPNEPENELMSRMRSVKSVRDSLAEPNESWIQDESEADSRFDADQITRMVKQFDPLVGKVLFGTYKIESVIGEGAMGIVYKAKQLAFDRYVAMKTIKAIDPDISNRFAQEVKVHSQLKHENIVEAIDCLIAPNGQVFFVMEFLSGIELEDLVKTKELSDKPLDFAEIVIQILEALDVAHLKGFIHRDLKPGNVVLVQQEGKIRVKVVDFGIAKLQEDVQKLTKTGQALGSPLYMSPEQCMGEAIDGRSDLYSLGILMYEVLTGELPFLGKDMVETMSLHCDAAKLPPKVAFRLPDLPCVDQLDQILAKALSTYPQNRYQDCTEFKKAIQFWVKSIKENAPMRTVPGTTSRDGTSGSVSREDRALGSTQNVVEGAHALKPAAKHGINMRKPAKDSSFTTAIVAGIVFGLILTIFILITALFFMKEKLNDIKSHPTEIQSVQQIQPDKQPKNEESDDKSNKIRGNTSGLKALPVPSQEQKMPVEKPTKTVKKINKKPKSVAKTKFESAKPMTKKSEKQKSNNPFDDLRNMKE